MISDDASERQHAIFDSLVVRIERTLNRFGRRDSFYVDGDYSIYDDYCGYPQVKVSIGNLELLRPHVIEPLQQIVRDLRGWEIVVAVAVRGHYDDWPDMGLYIRADEIVDGLQRQYFPKEFRDIQYEGARPGTEQESLY